LTSSQVSRFWFKQSLNFIIEHPDRYSILLLKKLNLLINNTEINDNYNYYYYKRFSTILSYSPVTYCLIVSFGVLGIIISLAKWRKYTLVYAYIIAYIVSLLLFYVIGRYRLQLIPFVIIFASASIYWLWQKLKSQEYYTFVSAIILVTILWNVSMKDIEWVSAANNADILLFEAMRMTRTGDYDNATKKYIELVNTNRGLDQAHYGLAEIYYKRRQLDMAIIEYRKALEGRLTSNSALTRFKLGIALLDAHKGPEAMQEFKSSIAIDPEQVGSYFELARYYEDRGMLSESLEYWKELLAHDKSGSSTTLAKTKIADLTRKTYH
jgi:Tfp pilus assembly protein PilF